MARFLEKETFETFNFCKQPAALPALRDKLQARQCEHGVLLNMVIHPHSSVDTPQCAESDIVQKKRKCSVGEKEVTAVSVWVHALKCTCVCACVCKKYRSCIYNLRAALARPESLSVASARYLHATVIGNAGRRPRKSVG